MAATIMCRYATSRTHKAKTDRDFFRTDIDSRCDVVTTYLYRGIVTVYSNLDRPEDVRPYIEQIVGALNDEVLPAIEAELAKRLVRIQERGFDLGRPRRSARSPAGQ
jgi:hypothetical protein